MALFEDALPREKEFQVTLCDRLRDSDQLGQRPTDSGHNRLLCSSQATELPKYGHFNEGQNPALKSLPATGSHSEVHQSRTGRTYFIALSHLPQAFCFLLQALLELTPPDIICLSLQLDISQRNKLLNY